VGRTRAKRLRGYGNAIVRPLAVAFVEAVIDVLVDAALPPDACVNDEVRGGDAPAEEEHAA
jgi:hypothetical protein